MQTDWPVVTGINSSAFYNRGMSYTVPQFKSCKEMINGRGCIKEFINIYISDNSITNNAIKPARARASTRPEKSPWIAKHGIGQAATAFASLKWCLWKKVN